MAYSLVDFERHAAALENDVRAGRAAPGVHDRQVLQALAERVERALAIAEDHQRRAEQHHAACLKMVEQMQVLLQKRGPRLGMTELKSLRTSGRFVVNAEQAIRERQGERDAALQQFHGDWPARYASLLADSQPLRALQATRSTSRKAGEAADATAGQLATLVRRAQDLVRQAEQAAG